MKTRSLSRDDGYVRIDWFSENTRRLLFDVLSRNANASFCFENTAYVEVNTLFIVENDAAGIEHDKAVRLHFDQYGCNISMQPQTH